MSLRSLTAIGAALALATACGSSEHNNPAGSKQNPLAGKPTQLTADGRSNEAAGSGAGSLGAGSSAVVAHGRSTPCRLVTGAQASSILGAPVKPLRAPQGPTCIYRTKTGKGFVTLAVQPLRYDALLRSVKHPARTSIARHAAFCGTYGQSMLYAQITRGWVLSIAAPCGVAREFAAKALVRVD